MIFVPMPSAASSSSEIAGPFVIGNNGKILIETADQAFPPSSECACVTKRSERNGDGIRIRSQQAR
jgi:hypothetical protein